MLVKLDVKYLRYMSLIITSLSVTFFSSYSYSKQNSKSESEVKQAIIQRSINNYPGNCACPYNTTSNGRSCGRRSAYSKKGGHSPLCYAEDVTDKMVKSYKGI